VSMMVGTNRLQRLHQTSRSGRTVQIFHFTADAEHAHQAQGAFIGVSQRQHRKVDDILGILSQTLLQAGFGVPGNRVMGERDALGGSRRSRSVENDGDIVGIQGFVEHDSGLPGSRNDRTETRPGENLPGFEVCSGQILRE
jgi:hypothetical protein